MSSANEQRRVSRLIGGALLLLVGGLFILQNLGVLSAGWIGDYWPLVLVWLGLSRLLAPGDGSRLLPGTILLLLGVFFQLDRLELIGFSFEDLWPGVLIAAGLALIAGSLRARRSGAGAVDGMPGPGSLEGR